MSTETYTQIIQDILDHEAGKLTFAEHRLELAWRIGYLTGMLDKLACNDYTIAHLLEQQHELSTGKKKKN